MMHGRVRGVPRSRPYDYDKNRLSDKKALTYPLVGRKIYHEIHLKWLITYFASSASYLE